MDTMIPNKNKLMVYKSCSENIFKLMGFNDTIKISNLDKNNINI